MVENHLPGLLLTAVLVAGASLVPLAYSDYPPPLQQIRDGGVNPEDVQCNNGLVHAVRANGDHVCVRETTADRLGWKIFVVGIEPPHEESSAAIVITGTSESIPSTEGKKFRILVDPDIVTGANFVPGCGLFFTLTPNSGEESLLVKIPKNLPILAIRSDMPPMMVIGDGLELPSELIESDCFYTYATTVQSPTFVELLYAYVPTDEPSLISKSVDTDCLEQVFVNRGADGYEVVLSTSCSTESVDDGREVKRSTLQRGPPPWSMCDTIMSSEINPNSIISGDSVIVQSTTHEKYSVSPGVGFYIEDWMPTYILDGQKLLCADTGCCPSGNCCLKMQFAPTTFVLNENVTNHDLDASKGYLAGVEYGGEPLDEIEDAIEYIREVFESQPGEYGGFVNMTRDGKTVLAHEGGGGTALNHYLAVLSMHLDEHATFGVVSNYCTLDETTPVFESMGN